MVATGVFSRMNSPGCTRRSETEPATGALIDGVGQLLLRQLVGGAAILQAGLQAADGVERRLIVRLRDLQPRLGGVAIGLRQQAPRRSAAARARSALRASSRLAVAWRTEAIWSSAGGCLSWPRSMPSCASTCRSALSARSRASCQLARLEPDEDVAGAHLGAELHAHVADDAGDLAADARLIGRQQRAREVDLALHRHPLDRRRSTGLHGRRRGRRGRRRPPRPPGPVPGLPFSRTRQRARNECVSRNEPLSDRGCLLT